VKRGHFGPIICGLLQPILTAKHGAAKAIVATACKIARIVYHMLKDKREYVDHGADYYEHKYQEQALNKLERQAAKLLTHPNLSIFVHPAEAKPKRSRGASD